MRFGCCVLVTFCLNFCIIFLETTASKISEDFALLPRIFYVNETEVCPKDHFYCKVDIKLKPKNVEDPPKIWELIKKKSWYNRDLIFRAFCIGGESIEEKLDQELLQYNLTGNILKSHCTHKINIVDAFGSIDALICSAFLAYFAFVIFCTIKTSNPKNDANKYQKMFSVWNIWNEINRPNKNEDFNKLLCIQGMRSFGMIFVVGVHSVLIAMIMKFIRNPEYFEDIPNSLAKSIYYGSFGLIVQIYFIISAWLLSVQLHNFVKKNVNFTCMDLLILWMNRYLRFLPCIVMTLLMHNSDILAVSIAHPYHYAMVRTEVKRCRVIWWKNLLFMQNLNVKENEICSPGMWYLAVDMQLYMIFSALFYISRRFKISMKCFFGLIAVVSASMQMFYVFTTENDALMHFNPKILPIEDVISRQDHIGSYIKAYGSAITYIIGFAFGTFYWHNKKKVVFDETVQKLFFYGAFLGIPILASYLYEFGSNRIVEALLSVSLRPLFAFGIAVGLLGMAFGSGGYIKQFFESAPMVYFGTFTFSIYMSHFAIVFGRATYGFDYVEMDDFYWISNWIIDVICSFSFGMGVYMLFEHPFIRLQKTLVPQTSNRKIQEKAKEK